MFTTYMLVAAWSIVAAKTPANISDIFFIISFLFSLNFKENVQTNFIFLKYGAEREVKLHAVVVVLVGFQWEAEVYSHWGTH